MTADECARDGAQNKHALAGLVVDRFKNGLTIDDTISDLPIAPMKLGFETPGPLIVSKRIVGWTESEIDAWIAAHQEPGGASDAPNA